jgi:hypothetical protein
MIAWKPAAIWKGAATKKGFGFRQRAPIKTKERADMDMDTMDSRALIDAALKKLTEEIADLNDGEPCKDGIAEILLDRVGSSEAAMLALDESKHVDELNGMMWDEARKRKHGRGAFIPDSELVAMADRYFGWDSLAVSEPSGTAADFIDVLELI